MNIHLQCPHCKNPIELVKLEPSQEINCAACGSSFRLDDAATATWLPSGQTVGRFELVAQVGHGAFGTVYKARDPQLDRTVAVKVPRRGNVGEQPQDLERFLREARSVAQLRHPGIVTVHEVGQTQALSAPLGRAESGMTATPYLVSDFIEGVTLADVLTSRRPAPREAAQLMVEAADALAYAHEQGVVHRDIKPSNIMIRPDGSPVVMDFGLAKRDAGEITMTIDGQVLGTPAYMSPEQARGEGHQVDGRSDIYGLGVILYQLLTGELPFRGNTRMLLHQVLHDEPRQPRTLNDRIPRDLETIALHAMAKEPARRYATARELADDLRRFLKGEPIWARSVGNAERAWRWCRRNPGVASALGLAGTALVAVAVVSLVSAQAQRRVNKDLADVNLDLSKANNDLTVSQARAAKLLEETQQKAALLALEQARSDAEAGETHRAMVRYLQGFQAAAPGPAGEAIREAARTRLDALRDVAPILRQRLAGALDSHFSADGMDLIYVRTEQQAGAKSDAGGGLEVIHADAATGAVKTRHHVPVALRAPVEGPMGPTILLSPDGKTLCLFGEEERPADHGSAKPESIVAAERMEIWDVRSGQRRHVSADDVKRTNRPLAFSPDGKTIVGNQMLRIADDGKFGGGGKKRPDLLPDRFCLWDVETGTARTLERSTSWGGISGGMVGNPLHARFSPDGKTVVAVRPLPMAIRKNLGGTRIDCWDVATGKSKPGLKLPDSPDFAVFSPDSRLLALGIFVSANEYEMQVHDLANGDIKWRHSGPGELAGLAYHPDGQAILALKLASVSDHGHGQWLNADNGAVLGPAFPLGKVAVKAQLARHFPFSVRAAFNGIAVSATGRRLLVPGERGETQVWDLPDDRLIAALMLAAPTAEIDYADAKTLLTAHALVASVGPPLDPVLPKPVRASGKSAAGKAPKAIDPPMSSDFGPNLHFQVRLWDSQTSEQRVVTIGGGKYHGLSTHARSGRVALIKETNESRPSSLVEIWNLTPARLAQFEVADRTPLMAWSADGRFLATSPSVASGIGAKVANKIQVWEAATGREVRHWDSLGRAAKIHPDGKHLVAASAGSVQFLPLEGEAAPISFVLPMQEAAIVLAIHPGGRKVALTTGNFVVKLWNVDDVSGPELVVEAAQVLFSPEGRYLIALDRNKEIRFHDLLVGGSFTLRAEHPAPLRKMALSPDGKRLATLCEARQVRQWALPQPLGGDIEHLRLWVETTTGLELGAHGAVTSLEPGTWLERQAAFAKLGGPPPEQQVAPWHLRQALRRHDSGNAAGVLWHAERHLGANPGDWQVVGWQAKAYGRLRRFADAKAALERSLMLMPRDSVLAHWYYDDLAALAGKDAAKTAELTAMVLAAAGVKETPPTLLAPRRPSKFGIANRHLLQAKDFAANKEFSKAIAAFESALAEEPQNHGTHYNLAALLLLTDMLPRYLEVSQGMLERFADDDDVYASARAAKINILGPEPKDLGRLSALIDRALTKGKVKPFRPYYLVAKGFAEYRAGNWQAAIDVIDQALPEVKKDSASLYSAAQGLFFQAMAHHRLKRPAQAKARLAEAIAALEAYERESQLPLFWAEHVIARLARREAEKLIGSGPPP